MSFCTEGGNPVTDILGDKREGHLACPLKSGPP